MTSLAKEAAFLEEDSPVVTVMRARAAAEKKIRDAEERLRLVRRYDAAHELKPRSGEIDLPRSLLRIPKKPLFKMDVK